MIQDKVVEWLVDLKAVSDAKSDMQKFVLLTDLSREMYFFLRKLAEEESR